MLGNRSISACCDAVLGWRSSGLPSSSEALLHGRENALERSASPTFHLDKRIRVPLEWRVLLLVHASCMGITPPR